MKDIAKDKAEELGSALAGFYNRAFLYSARTNLFGFCEKIVGYRKVRVPKYLEMTVPVLEKHYDDGGDFEGLLVTTRTVRICRIGTKIEKEPIYEKPKKKGGVTKFRRYSNLSNPFKYDEKAEMSLEKLRASRANKKNAK